MAATDAATRTDIRVYLLVEDLQRQFAAYLGTPTRARGYPPYEGEHALIVEVSPALAIERVIDLALREVPGIQPGILYVERQFGVLEVHSHELADVRRAGEAILHGTGNDGGGPAAAAGAVPRHHRANHRSARGDPQPQPAGFDDPAGTGSAGLRDDTRPVRGGGGQRGRACGASSSRSSMCR